VQGAFAQEKPLVQWIAGTSHGVRIPDAETGKECAACQGANIMEPKLETQHRAFAWADTEPGLGTLITPSYARNLVAIAVGAVGLAYQATFPCRLRADQPTQVGSTAAQEPVQANPVPPVPPPLPGVQASRGHQIYQKMLRACVFIKNEYGFGSGWVVDRSERLLITNHHVISGGVNGIVPQDSIQVFFPEKRDGKLLNEKEVVSREGRHYQVHIIDFDVMRDLAVLQVVADLPPDVEPLRTAPASCEEGDTVHSMGNAQGPVCWVYKTGTVESVHLFEKKVGKLVFGRFQCVKTTDPIWHGDSGGPVVNDNGELVAVTDLLEPFTVQNEANQTAQMIQTGVAIDVSEVRTFLDEVRPMLHPKTADDYQRRGLRHMSRNRFDEAVPDFEEAMKRLPPGTDEAAILFNRAKAYAGRGQMHGSARAD